MEKAHRGRALAEIALGAGLVAKLLVLNTVLAVEAFPTRRASVSAPRAVAPAGAAVPECRDLGPALRGRRPFPLLR